MSTPEAPQKKSRAEIEAAIKKIEEANKQRDLRDAQMREDLRVATATLATIGKEKETNKINPEPEAKKEPAPATTIVEPAKPIKITPPPEPKPKDKPIVRINLPPKPPTKPVQEPEKPKEAPAPTPAFEAEEIEKTENPSENKPGFLRRNWLKLGLATGLAVGGSYLGVREAGKNVGKTEGNVSVTKITRDYSEKEKLDFEKAKAELLKNMPSRLFAETNTSKSTPKVKPAPRVVKTEQPPTAGPVTIDDDTLTKIKEKIREAKAESDKILAEKEEELAEKQKEIDRIKARKAQLEEKLKEKPAPEVAKKQPREKITYDKVVKKAREERLAREAREREENKNTRLEPEIGHNFHYGPTPGGVSFDNQPPFQERNEE